MKILIQELIKGKVEIVEKDIAIDIIKELIERQIPFKIDYVNKDENIFDTIDTNKNKGCVNSKSYRM